MASGNLGAANLIAVTNTTIYTVPAAKVATVNVSICNRGSAPIAVRIASSATATPATAEWLEYDVSIPANGVIERTGIVMEATRNIVVYSNIATASVLAFGFEE